MKIIATLVLTLGIGAAVMAASVSPVAPSVEKKEAAAPVLIVQPAQGHEITGAIKVIAPQKDLESAIRSSEKGDILLQGNDGWYRIDAKALNQGIKMYVLGGQSSMISVFPKEAEASSTR